MKFLLFVFFIFVVFAGFCDEEKFEAAVEEAKRLADEGFVALELCAGFGIQGQAEIMKAVEGKMLVGAVRFDNHPAYGGISGDEKWGK